MKSDDTPPLGDMDPEAFRRAGHQLVDWIGRYLEDAERYPVQSRAKPGELRAALPPAAPEIGESMETIFADVERYIVPGLTHWNHPGFFAYFAISGSGPGVLAEFLSAAFNAQGMLWRTSPAVTELEEVALGWLRRLLGLPDVFEGVIYDTASISTLHALAAARQEAAPGGARTWSRRSAGAVGPARLLLRTRTFVGRQGGHHAGTGAGGAAARRHRRPIPDAARRPCSCDRRGPPEWGDAARCRRHCRHDRRHERRPGAGDR